MGGLLSKSTIYPDDDVYHHLLESAADTMKPLIANIENTMTSFCVRPTSIWYLTITLHDNKEKKLIVTQNVFMKLFKRYATRGYTITNDGDDIIIQFVHEGKSV